jgi:hypothetical protein
MKHDELENPRVNTHGNPQHDSAGFPSAESSAKPGIFHCQADLGGFCLARHGDSAMMRHILILKGINT